MPLFVNEPAGVEKPDYVGDLLAEPGLGARESLFKVDPHDPIASPQREHRGHA
jgi:hypothetical protein